VQLTGFSSAFYSFVTTDLFSSLKFHRSVDPAMFLIHGPVNIARNRKAREDAAERRVEMRNDRPSRSNFKGI
jgi:hypothetical protein